MALFCVAFACIIFAYMYQLGLIGRPLKHSFSKKYFTEKWVRSDIHDFRYELYPLATIEELPALLRQHTHLIGLNVTIPYKREVIPFVHELRDAAADIRAVNTIVVAPAGQLTGYNTDVVGFERSLLRLLGSSVEDELRALVLGTGGAARAVIHVLQNLNIPCHSVSRRPGTDQLGYADLDRKTITDHRLIVNTTPLGTFPAVDQAPDLPYAALSSRHFLFDLVYNPAETRFLRHGRERGAKTTNGYDMLVGQAEAAWEIWQAALADR